MIHGFFVFLAVIGGLCLLCTGTFAVLLALGWLFGENPDPEGRYTDAEKPGWDAF